MSDTELSARIEHPDFNRRSIRGDGAPMHRDIRQILYRGGR
jgi:hypothetical protein